MVTNDEGRDDSTPTPTPTRGHLVLVPNALDHGSAGEAIELSLVLPMLVIRRAAMLRHWVVENAKPARAFLRRVHAAVPLLAPIQALQIQELPRADKGSASTLRPRDDGASAWSALLAPALAGHDIGLLSDAGLPGVADPGADLVAQAHRLGVVVEALPGASSITLALAASGLQGQRFAFVGYVPSSEPARSQQLRDLESRSRQGGQTQVLIETPYRNASLMTALLNTLSPTTLLAVSSGLTLDGGWNRTATVQAWRKAPPTFAADHPAVFCLLAG